MSIYILLLIIVELKEEAEELSKYLAMDITVLEFKDNMMMIDYKDELEKQIAG